MPMADVYKRQVYYRGNSNIECVGSVYRLKLVKCPICELNYMPADAEMCDVCRNERKKSKKKDAPVIQICPECNENPVVPGEEFCAACLREHKRCLLYTSRCV